MNHRAFQRCRQIRRRLGRLGVVPNRHFVSRRQLQHTIEIVLPRTTLIVDQLGDAETMNRLLGLSEQAAGAAEKLQPASHRSRCSDPLPSACELRLLASVVHRQMRCQLQLTSGARFTTSLEYGLSVRVLARSISATNHSLPPSLASSSVAPESINRSSARESPRRRASACFQTVRAMRAAFQIC